MPAISKIRLTNVVYEEGQKRYNDELFLFDGHNGAILLENGGGKTVLIQTVLQAILPHTHLADRKIKDTLLLENAPAHIAIEWMINEQPRRYVVTCVSLFLVKNALDSLRYVYEYDANDDHSIENIPFVRLSNGMKRPAEKGEILDYFSAMRDRSIRARTFQTIKEYKAFIEEQYHIISSEWESIVKINSTEGGVEAFFDSCKSTSQLFDNLLIPTVENSIAGHDPNNFADLFEKQRESFHAYKKLKESIAENKQIQQELERYVQTFQKLNHEEINYVHAKEQAKGAWTIIHEQKREASQEQMALQSKKVEWQEKTHLYHVKKASYEILREEKTLTQKDQDYKHLVAVVDEKIEQLKETEQYYYSLKLADLQKQLKEHADELSYIEEQLAQFERSEELIDFEEKLEEAKRALLGTFQEAIEKLSKERENISYELNPLQNQLGESKLQHKEATGKKQENENNRSKVEGRNSELKKTMERLKQQLLSNPEQEKVEEELTKWMERVQFLDEEIIRLQQLGRQIKKQIDESEERKEVLAEERSTVTSQQNRMRFEQEQIDQSQQKLIGKLALVRPQWAALEQIYLSQESIESRLLEEIGKGKRVRDEWLYRERLAYRFVDDYGKQESFFGDPFLAQQLKVWKNQFDFVTTGIEYLQQLVEEEREKKKNYPLWPLTVITLSKFKQGLVEKIQHIQDQLQYPISVLTIEEAAQIGQEHVEETWIAPQHWQENCESSSFVTWKENVAANALQITNNREEKEKELSLIEDVLKEFNQFLHDYPHAQYEHVKSELSRLSIEHERLTSTMQKERQYIRDCQREIETTVANQKRFEEEKNGLEVKVEKATEYRRLDKESSELTEKERQYEKIDLELIKEVARLSHNIERITEEVSHLNNRQRELDFKLRSIEESNDYLAVKNLQPIYTGESQHTISVKMRDLELKIKNITTSRGEWQVKYEAIVQSKANLTKQMVELREDHEDLLEDLLFPTDGSQLLSSLKMKVAKLESEAKTLATERDQKKSERDVQKGIVETKRKLFHDQFPDTEVFSFTASLHEIEFLLQKEQKNLSENNQYLEQEFARMQKELKAIEEAERELERFEEGHHFTAPEIVGILFTQEIITEFTYNRKAFVLEITNRLKESKENVLREKQQVDLAKRQFREFCHSSITDVKMRNMALNGIEYKQTYDDIITFRNNMNISVERATHYANEHIRQKDAEMQAFINQIHHHLQTVVEELKHIPNKTKVKVEDNWKQIFNFSIPEWQEDDGKNRIRDHIEWILAQLESNRFINEQGKEDTGKVRKEIETWLHSKQLLQIVMNNEVMKVSCRKVTNDGNVTTRSYSWEQSNIWSGGEKWSKNMTLFLGILKYVAEKKKHTQTKMKRHRTVILDNPFGKASSDHVLNPVFFVAEQLGFQLIALTAHAEGKFLQDYFPIIYSCRLRPSKDQNKNIMTKEKWLHHAYFQDHEPKALERLGETEQMMLFE